MPRTTEEWIAKNDDQAIPERVKLRIWEREKGRCHLTGKQIRPGDKYDFEHVIALADGGEHRETNLRLALRGIHRKKTAQEATARAKVRSKAKKYAGIKKPSRMPGSKTHRFKKKMDGTVIDRETGLPV